MRLSRPTSLAQQARTLAVAFALADSGCGQLASSPADSAPPLPCTTGAPDLTESAAFDVDTGFAPLMDRFGSTYGSPTCPKQLLVDVDLTSSTLKQANLAVFGQWSESLPPKCSGLRASMTVYGLPAAAGSSWTTWDRVLYEAGGAGGCKILVASHANPAFDGQQGTTAPEGMFRDLRVAAMATRTSPSGVSQEVPVAIVAEVTP